MTRIRVGTILQSKEGAPGNGIIERGKFYKVIEISKDKKWFKMQLGKDYQHEFSVGGATSYEYFGAVEIEMNNINKNIKVI